MQRSEWLMLIWTFCFGMVAGGYMYFVGFAPLGVEAPERPSDTGDSFSVVAEERGICHESARGCGSYRLLGNRDYRFVRSDATGGIQDSRTGLLSQNLFAPLVEELNVRYQRNQLDIYPQTPPSCTEQANEIQYRIEIADYGVFYLAACDSAVSVDDALLRALTRVSQAFPF